MTLLPPAAVNCRYAMRWQLTTAGFQRQLIVVALCYMNNIGVSKTPLLRIEDQEVPFFPIVADSTSITLTKSNMSQNQGNVELNKKKEGDDKKKEKSPMTWHGITCDGSVKKKDS
ncbi:hypothetical protein MTR_8g099675 [Medicago truncatula]|uniref:Uncharacterized protein n=1 Tax=Medicago truncatula TaxID=3880 RepID=A0A072TVR0_MEDTR|nr:hypothetical protein MTR_8g099675 [Medicago truncatula]